MRKQACRRRPGCCPQVVWPVYPRAAVVIALFGVVWCALSAISCADRAPRVASAVTGQVAQQVLGLDVLGEGPSAWGAWQELYGGGDAEAFAAQVADFEGFDVTVSPDGGTACLMREGNAAQALDEAAGCMEAAGWLRIESGSTAACTFVRASAHPSWAAVTATQTGGTTTIVLVIEGVTS